MGLSRKIDTFRSSLNYLMSIWVPGSPSESKTVSRNYRFNKRNGSVETTDGVIYVGVTETTYSRRGDGGSEGLVEGLG